MILGIVLEVAYPLAILLAVRAASLRAYWARGGWVRALPPKARERRWWAYVHWARSSSGQVMGWAMVAVTAALAAVQLYVALTRRAAGSGDPGIRTVWFVLCAAAAGAAVWLTLRGRSLLKRSDPVGVAAMILLACAATPARAAVNRALSSQQLDEIARLERLTATAVTHANPATRADAARELEQRAPTAAPVADEANSRADRNGPDAEMLRRAHAALADPPPPQWSTDSPADSTARAVHPLTVFVIDILAPLAVLCALGWACLYLAIRPLEGEPGRA
jgi:hypothetical protein